MKSNLCHLDNETGRCLPDISLFNEIFSLFEISLDELLAREKNKKIEEIVKL